MGNKKYALISLFSNLFLLLFAVCALVGINIEVAAVQSAPPTEGLDFRGLSIGILTIFAALILIYGGVVLINVILGSLQLGTGKWGFAIPSLVIGIILLIANLLFLITAVNDGGLTTMLIAVPVAVASLASLIANGRSIATRD